MNRQVHSTAQANSVPADSESPLGVCRVYTLILAGLTITVLRLFEDVHSAKVYLLGPYIAKPAVRFSGPLKAGRLNTRTMPLCTSRVNAVWLPAGS